MNILRLYLDATELASDGYPRAWHSAYALLDDDGNPSGTIKDHVREQAGHRCVRCGHPYRNGEHGNGEWSSCDERCTHGGPVRYQGGALGLGSWSYYDGPDVTVCEYVEARWRILTVHHLNGVKHDCRWWNLAALCQRCHLTIQARVVMDRAYLFEHSEWFKPYAAGWYAWSYLGEDITREQADLRLEELLGLERLA